jgi:hypothetical protein
MPHEKSPVLTRVFCVHQAYASRETNTVERCFELAEALEALGPLRPRDLLALLRACREAGDVERADRVLEMIHQCGRAQVGASGQDGWGGEALGEAFDVSLATEVCRAHLLAGRTEDAKAVFEEIPFDSRDLALYNVLVESLDPSTASRVFDEAWQRGLFGRRRRKLTANRRVVHIDLHRLGLRMAELAMDKHLQELQSPGRGDVAGSVKAVKVIVGKGKPNPGKTRLCEHVRGLLYDRGIANRETWPGVFTLQLHDW